MGLLRAVTTTAIFAVTTGTETYTYTEMPLPGTGLLSLRQVQVQGPAVINIDRFSFLSNGPETNSSVSIVFAPIGSNVSHSVRCTEHEQLAHPTCDKNCGKLSFSKGHRAGQVVSSKIAIPASGSYNLYIASCAKSGGVSTFTISSPNLGAHEQNWWIYFACLVVFYLGTAIVWRRIQRSWDVDRASLLVQEVNIAIVASLCTAVVGLLLHAIPEKNTDLLKFLFVVAASFSVSSLMFTLVLASASGGTRPDMNRFTAGWGVLFFSFVWFLADSWTVYEAPCNDHPCDSQEQLPKHILPVLACFVVYGFFCIRYIARSLRYFQQVGQQSDLLGCQRLSCVIFVYSVLVASGMAIRIVDVPTNPPNPLGFHCLSEICFGQFTQAFGILATICVLAKMDLRPVDTEDDRVKPRGYEQVDEEKAVFDIPNGENNDECADPDLESKKGDASPVVYGSQG